MKRGKSAPSWLLAACLLAPCACVDRPLNLLPDPLEAAQTGGAPGVPSTASGGVAGGASGSSASGAGDGANSAGGSSGQSGAAVAGSSNLGGAGTDGTGGASAGGVGGNGGNSGNGGGSGGSGGGCRTDADCAPPTPGCSLTAHVCKHCSNNSQCPTGKLCSLDDGECG